MKDMQKLKYYQHKVFIISIQILTILTILLVNIDTNLKLMLIFGYIMLFRQERWHKHLLIMFVMIFTMFIASGGYDIINYFPNTLSISKNTG